MTEHTSPAASTAWSTTTTTTSLAPPSGPAPSPTPAAQPPLLTPTSLKYDTQGLPPLMQLLAVAVVVLQQAVDLVENVLTSDEQLTTPSRYLPGSTIGKHLRHARDHFVLLLDSITGPAPRVFSFDMRIRDTPMESNRTAARDALNDAIKRLEEAVPKAELNAPMTLRAVTPHMQTLETSFGRELWFVSLHAVHHWSMVRVIAGEMGIELTAEFGFAPSTLLYRGVQEKARI